MWNLVDKAFAGLLLDLCWYHLLRRRQTSAGWLTIVTVWLPRRHEAGIFQLPWLHELPLNIFSPACNRFGRLYLVSF
jgi:hypothetical protein